MTWLRPDEAAVWLRTTVAATHVLAHREGWRRQGVGRETRYLFEDVAATHARRQERHAEREG